MAGKICLVDVAEKAWVSRAECCLVSGVLEQIADGRFLDKDPITQKLIVINADECRGLD